MVFWEQNRNISHPLVRWWMVTKTRIALGVCVRVCMSMCRVRMLTSAAHMRQNRFGLPKKPENHYRLCLCSYEMTTITHFHKCTLAMLFFGICNTACISKSRTIWTISNRNETGSRDIWFLRGEIRNDSSLSQKRHTGFPCGQLQWRQHPRGVV